MWPCLSDHGRGRSTIGTRLHRLHQRPGDDHARFTGQETDSALQRHPDRHVAGAEENRYEPAFLLGEQVRVRKMHRWPTVSTNNQKIHRRGKKRTVIKWDSFVFFYIQKSWAIMQTGFFTLHNKRNIWNSNTWNDYEQNPNGGWAGPEIHPDSREGEGRLLGPPDTDLHWPARRLVHHHFHQHLQVRNTNRIIVMSVIFVEISCD